ncbi:hypothetical protein FQN50_004215 [Emmonsiellopsis sp. PD_5]|nr:hypothetical protein FQN50_004215 [Emmonsiellopsis sp. PD_5]
MPDKRKAPSSTSSGSPYTKRARPAEPNDDLEESHPVTITPPTARQQPRNDPIYGQKHAFPGLDDPTDGEELFYGPAEDGIEYLRMVRSEARTLPSIFVSKTILEKQGENLIEEEESSNAIPHATTSLKPNHTGFYSDGVYISTSHIPPAPANDDDDNPQPPDPQEAYYNLLHHRFLLLRSTLKCTPPASIIASLGDNHPIILPPNNKRARQEWERIIKTMDPRMAQLACMDGQSVLGLLRIVARMLSGTVVGGEAEGVKRLGAWAWGLLGRCRAVGEMGSEEVGDVREVGKRAARILVKVRESEEVVRAMEEMEGEEDAEEEEGEGGEGGVLDGGDGGGEVVDKPVPVESGEEIVLEIPESIPPQPEEYNDAAMTTTTTTNVTTHTTTVEDELEAAKARLQARLLPQNQQQQPTEIILTTPPPPNGVEVEVEDGEIDQGVEYAVLEEPTNYTRAMLDMIISIVGEFYGQRDLLEFRDIWEEDPGMMDVGLGEVNNCTG